MIRVNNIDFLARAEKEVVIYNFVKKLADYGLINFFDDGLYSLSEKMFLVMSAADVFEDYAFTKLDIDKTDLSSEVTDDKLKTIKLLSKKDQATFISNFVRTLIDKKIIDIFYSDFGFDYDKLSALESALMVFDNVSFIEGLEQPWYTD